MGEHPGIRRLFHLGSFFNQFKNTCRTGKRILKLRKHAGDFVEGLGILVGVA